MRPTSALLPPPGQSASGRCQEEPSKGKKTPTQPSLLKCRVAILEKLDLEPGQQRFRSSPAGEQLVRSLLEVEKLSRLQEC